MSIRIVLHDWRRRIAKSSTLSHGDGKPSRADFIDIPIPAAEAGANGRTCDVDDCRVEHIHDGRAYGECKHGDRRRALSGRGYGSRIDDAERERASRDGCPPRREVEISTVVSYPEPGGLATHRNDTTVAPDPGNAPYWRGRLLTGRLRGTTGRLTIARSAASVQPGLPLRGSAGVPGTVSARRGLRRPGLGRPPAGAAPAGGHSARPG
jgi:hypothetical protein